MAGPFFEFLVVDDGEYWERVGSVQRTRGIKPGYLHRSDALRVPDALMECLAPLFRNANPAFDYFGATEYKGEAISTLSSLLLDECRNHGGGAAIGALEDAARAIVEHARTATDTGMVLLVLGI